MVWKGLVDLPVAVVVQPVTKLICRRPNPDRTAEAETVASARENSHSQALTDSDFAGLAEAFKILVNRLVAVIVLVVADLIRGGYSTFALTPLPVFTNLGSELTPTST